MSSINQTSRSTFYIVCLLLWVFCSACSTTKYVPKESYLLDKTTIKGAPKGMNADELSSYIKQKPNEKVLGIYRMQLHIYSLSGRDSTKWWNRIIRRMGQEPVIYDERSTLQSEQELTNVLKNRGYLLTTVTSSLRVKKKKAQITYQLYPRKPYTIASFTPQLSDTVLRYLQPETGYKPLIGQGARFDVDLFEAERANVAANLRNKGFFSIDKSQFSYSADTTLGDHQVGIEMEAMRLNEVRYHIRNVFVDIQYDPAKKISNIASDTVTYRGLRFLNARDPWIKLFMIGDACRIRPGQLFSDDINTETYNAITQLRSIKYIHIRYETIPRDSSGLNCFIFISPAKKQSFGTEVEGTNSAGDLGFALVFNYQHNNLFRTSEVFSSKIRVAYERLTGGAIRSNYIEVGGEMGITYPRFLFPFVSSAFKGKVRANTETTFSYNFQDRPEYTRVIAGAGWRYKWRSVGNHSLDFADLSYTYLPFKSQSFRDAFENEEVDPLIRHSYEDLFILRTGYNYYRTNQPINGGQRAFTYSVRAGGEVAGNTLYTISSIFNLPRKDNGYEVFGIRYAQYARGEFDFAFKHQLDGNNEIAYRIGGGIAFPYGNLLIVPFEKRFFAGGANNNRGWSVRSLGPGTFKPTSQSQTDYINQSGDIKLIMNFEYRTLLFYKFFGALFVDMGNVWTIKEYAGQPGGMFRFNSFYKELATSYGLGIRFDINFFVFRLDLGFKAFDPGRIPGEKFRIPRMKFSEDSTLHFAIGYPF